MSFQAYLDNIEAKTGKTPQDFPLLAERKGFLKPEVNAGEIVAWLKEDFGLGHGHAMAIVMVLKQVNSPRPGVDAKINALFSGSRSSWRKTYDELLGKVNKFGADVTDPHKNC
jgi:hypothetical protein